MAIFTIEVYSYVSCILSYYVYFAVMQ